jgi:hypothetical protein
MRGRSRQTPLILLFLYLASAATHAEPYFAVQQGLHCRQCHVNPAGGGLRTVFGNAFAQTQLPANRIDTGDQLWLGEISRFFAVGGNVRGNASLTDVPNQGSTYQYDVEEGRVYLSVSPIPERLVVYIDERVAPGAADNMEAYARYWTANRQWYIQAGKMYLPFGLRLEDDTAFTRTTPGINMATPDSGAQLGWESGSWSAQFAISNGAAGAAESDNGKQYSLQAVYVTSRWRLGAASSINNADAGDRNAYGVFGGLKTGPIAWLAEADLVTDDSFPEGERKLVSGLLEANWLVRQGHNLKATAEIFEPDRDVDEDQQTRWSLLYEYTPVQFIQVRTGVRIYDGIPQNDLQNRKLYFVQLHGFF